VDTDDLVQESLLRALDRLEEFEPRHEGAFLAYLRRILLNRITDEARRAGRQPGLDELPQDLVCEDLSPLERVLGREAIARYEAALATLSPREQEAVVMRVEMGFTHQQIAEAIGSPSWNAARMFVSRALLRLAEAVHGDP
jgi:RNA polymerase sigma-70 factor (ECF subfamily)